MTKNAIKPIIYNLFFLTQLHSFVKKIKTHNFIHPCLFLIILLILESIYQFCQWLTFEKKILKQFLVKFLFYL